MKWTGQDVDVHAAATAAGCVMNKHRETYIFCGFDSEGERGAFKTALGSVQGVSFSDWDYPHDPDLLVVRVVPA